MSNKQDELRPIIIKKVKKTAAGHHGGAWKVAYADFVTAMMAFFLLLWLLSVTTDMQKNGIADYFKPTPRVSNTTDGAGGILGGITLSPEGVMTSTTTPLATLQNAPDPAMRPGSMPLDKTPTQQGEKLTKLTDAQLMQEIKKREQENFKKAEAAIKKSIESSPELKDMAKALKVDMTPEGLRIQIIDQEGKPLFAVGSAIPLPHTKKLIRKLTTIIQKLPNEVSVRGHTDSLPYGSGATYTNWELSSDRANASRRELVKAGIPKTRINNVVGKSDTDHLFAENANDPRNRRISIILLHEYLTLQEGASMSTNAVKRELEAQKSDKKLYKRSEGSVSFP